MCPIRLCCVRPYSSKFGGSLADAATSLINWMCEMPSFVHHLTPPPLFKVLLAVFIRWSSMCVVREAAALLRSPWRRRFYFCFWRRRRRRSRPFSFLGAPYTLYTIHILIVVLRTARRESNRAHRKSYPTTQPAVCYPTYQPRNNQPHSPKLLLTKNNVEVVVVVENPLCDVVSFAYAVVDFVVVVVVIVDPANAQQHIYTRTQTRICDVYPRHIHIYIYSTPHMCRLAKYISLRFRAMLARRSHVHIIHSARGWLAYKRNIYTWWRIHTTHWGTSSIHISWICCQQQNNQSGEQEHIYYTTVVYRTKEVLCEMCDLYCAPKVFGFGKYLQNIENSFEYWNLLVYNL